MVESQILADSQSKLMINQSKQQFKVIGDLPYLKNLYPGYYFVSDEYIIENKNGNVECKMYLQSEPNFFKVTDLDITLTIIQNGKKIDYSFSELKQGIKINLKTDETIRLFVSFLLNGEKMGNETQDLSDRFVYHFLMVTGNSDISTSMPSKVTKLPNTNETKSSVLLIGLICISIYLFSINKAKW